MPPRRLCPLYAFVIAACFASPAAAVIVPYGSGRNLTPPTGALANAGWQWQAEFSGFLGTPISSKWFITAQHIGGAIGLPVVYNGQTTFTDAFVDVPNTDLRLWRVGGTFPNWAPMWTPTQDGTEIGKRLFVVGRGTQRGAAIIAPIDGPLDPGNSTQGQLEPNPDINLPLPDGYEIRGWKWGGEDRRQSWGENVVNTVVSGGTAFGPLLYFTFDSNGSVNEAALSTGDSGGGVFLRNSAGQWKLAGINFAVDGPFRETATGPSYFAALYDMGGFWAFENPVEYIDPGPIDQPSGAYASLISGSRSFINNVIAGTLTASSPQIPEPAAASAAMAAAAVAVVAGRRRRSP